MSRLARAAAAFVLLAVIASCGPQDRSDPNRVSARAWAKGVCQVIRPWAGTIQTAVSNTQTTVAKSGQPTVVKPQLITLFGGAAKSTDAAITDVTKAGTPDVTNGERIAKDFRTALVGARDAFATAQRSMQALDTSNKAKFDAAVAGIGTKLQKDYADANAHIAKATSAELTGAFDSEPACH